MLKFQHCVRKRNWSYYFCSWSTGAKVVVTNRFRKEKRKNAILRTVLLTLLHFFFELQNFDALKPSLKMQQMPICVNASIGKVNACIMCLELRSLNSESIASAENFRRQLENDWKSKTKNKEQRTQSKGQRLKNKGRRTQRTKIKGQRTKSKEQRTKEEAFLEKLACGSLLNEAILERPS